MPEPEIFVPERIPLDFNCPYHRKNGACRPIEHKDYIECSCGFQAFKPYDLWEDNKKWRSKRQLITMTCRCGEEFTKQLNSMSVLCPTCRKKKYNETQRKKREGQNRKIGRAGKLKAATT